jgi:hypothetical protein
LTHKLTVQLPSTLLLFQHVDVAADVRVARVVVVAAAPAAPKP